MAVTTKLYYSNFIPAYSNIGVPVPSAYMYFYLTGGTTLAPIYSDAAGTVPMANPVQANLAGKFPNIYLDASITYRVRLTDSSGVPLGNDADPYIPGTTSAGVNNGAYGVSWSGDTTTAPSRDATYTILNNAISLVPVYVGDSGSGGVKGLVKAPAAGDGAAGKFLKADGTWALPPGSGAGTTSNALTINNSGAGAASGSTFNGSAAITISYNTIGAAPLTSPAFTGTPTAPTAAALTNNTQLATTAYADAADSAFKVPVQPVSISFSAANADNNTYKVLSGASQTLTLGNIATGVSFSCRFTTAWSLSIAGGLSKNGASPTSVTTGSVAANSLISFLHEGGGVWVATGAGLT